MDVTWSILEIKPTTLSWRKPEKPSEWIFVCIFIKIKKSTQPISENLFSYIGMDNENVLGYIRSFTHIAELQETRKTIKKGCLGLYDENLLNCRSNYLQKHEIVRSIFCTLY